MDFTIQDEQQKKQYKKVILVYVQPFNVKPIAEGMQDLDLWRPGFNSLHGDKPDVVQETIMAPS